MISLHLAHCLEEIEWEIAALDCETLSNDHRATIMGHIEAIRAVIAEVSATPMPQLDAEDLDPAAAAEITADDEPVATERDDLTLIQGIDETTAARLASAGFDTFSRIAALTAADIAEISSLGMSSKDIAKQGWFEQAALLANGSPTLFARGLVAARLSPPALDAVADAEAQWPELASKPSCESHCPAPEATAGDIPVEAARELAKEADDDFVAEAQPETTTDMIAFADAPDDAACDEIAAPQALILAEAQDSEIAEAAEEFSLDDDAQDADQAQTEPAADPMSEIGGDTTPEIAERLFEVLQNTEAPATDAIPTDAATSSTPERSTVAVSVGYLTFIEQAQKAQAETAAASNVIRFPTEAKRTNRRLRQMAAAVLILAVTGVGVSLTLPAGFMVASIEDAAQ